MNVESKMHPAKAAGVRRRLKRVRPSSDGKWAEKPSGFSETTFDCPSQDTSAQAGARASGMDSYDWGEVIFRDELTFCTRFDQRRRVRRPDNHG